jgi:hypothetical protein
LTIGANLPSARELTANESISSPGVKLHRAGFMVTPNEAHSLGWARCPAFKKSSSITGMDATLRGGRVASWSLTYIRSRLTRCETIFLRSISMFSNE